MYGVVLCDIFDLVGWDTQIVDPGTMAMLGAAGFFAGVQCSRATAPHRVYNKVESCFFWREEPPVNQAWRSQGKFKETRLRGRRFLGPEGINPGGVQPTTSFQGWPPLCFSGPQAKKTGAQCQFF